MEQNMNRRDFLKQCGQCALFLAGVQAVPWLLSPDRAAAQTLTPTRGLLGRKLSPYFVKLDGGVIRCELCPRECEVDVGKRGYCRVRENVDGSYYSLAYGNPCSIHVDPVEKKPLFHVLPGSRSFSIATAGCNLNCKFCQNWEISQAKPDDLNNYALSPEQVVEAALGTQSQSIASTYVEPTIFTEYMIDIGNLARKRGILKVMHSNGFINPKPLDDLCASLGAACIDLKGFTEDYYREMTEGSLQPVLDTLVRLKQKGVHTELVNLMIPGKNDDMEHVKAMCRWIKNELSPDVPLHFTRFYPMYKLKSLPPTPVETLEKARAVALEVGLHYVFIGNVPGHAGEHTYCPKCGATLIQRLGYQVQLREFRDGRCLKCGQPVPGIWKRPEASI
jgi:pyruvate formate lyase activating enzyme